ncbi:MAG: prepilin-type N-terminal cleavage/methylation domain-containing protein [Gammaproteobacteria bacterium]
MYTTKPQNKQVQAKFNPQFSQGFTLMELLVTITIIGLLVGIGMPNFNRMMAKTKITSTLVQMQPYKLAIAEERLNGQKKEDISDKLIPIPELTHWKKQFPWIEGFEIKQGNIELKLSMAALGIAESDLKTLNTFVLKLETEDHELGGLTWKCSYTAGETKLQAYLPKECLRT